jgi:hypothetical protein
MSTLARPKAVPQHAPIGDDDARMWARNPCDVPTMCQPVAARGPDQPCWAARIRNIFTTGVGLVAVRRFERGTGVAIEIPDQGGLGTDTVLARVVRVQAAPEGGWLLGCTFISALSEETVQRLLHLRQGQSPPARPAQATGALDDDEVPLGELPPVDPGGTMILPKVYWRNRETGTKRLADRLFLMGNWPLRPGTMLKLWVDVKTGPGDFTTVVIHSCEREGKEWVVCYSILGKPTARMARFLKGN